MAHPTAKWRAAPQAQTLTSQEEEDQLRESLQRRRPEEVGREALPLAAEAEDRAPTRPVYPPLALNAQGRPPLAWQIPTGFKDHGGRLDQLMGPKFKGDLKQTLVLGQLSAVRPQCPLPAGP